MYNFALISMYSFILFLKENGFLTYEKNSHDNDLLNVRIGNDISNGVIA